MNRKISTLSMWTALLFSSIAAHAQKTTFWMGNGLASVHSFMEHKDKIDIIEPTWYHIEGDGLVTGEPNLPVLQTAKDAHMKIIPLFAIFDHKKLHDLANNAKAQDALIESLIRNAHTRGLLSVDRGNDARAALARTGEECSGWGFGLFTKAS